MWNWKGQSGGQALRTGWGLAGMSPEADITVEVSPSCSPCCWSWPVNNDTATHFLSLLRTPPEEAQLTLHTIPLLDFLQGIKEIHLIIGLEHTKPHIKDYCAKDNNRCLEEHQAHSFTIFTQVQPAYFGFRCAHLSRVCILVSDSATALEIWLTYSYVYLNMWTLV